MVASSLAALPLLFFCYIFMSSTYVESSNCPSIALSQSDKSTSSPVVSNGSNYTIYQLFITEGNVHDLNIVWSRIPSSLASSNGSYKLDTHTVNSTALNVSLTLWNIQPFPDDGNYTVVASNNCTDNGTYFVLKVDICEPNKLPQPITQKPNVTVIAEPQLPNVLHLVAEFRGISDLLYAPTDWKFEGSQCLEGSAHSNHFSCNRTEILTQCAFKADLWKTNVTYEDSGNYTVQARHDIKWSNASTIDLRIIRQPMIDSGSCTIEQQQISYKGHTAFTCRVSNYSEYTEVIVVENNKTSFHNSTNELSFGCWLNAPDPSIATCTVNVSTSLHSGKLHYKLCVGYNSSVTYKTKKLHCSHDITISIISDHKMEGWKLGMIIGGAVLALALVLVVLAGVIIKVVRRRSVLVYEELDDPTRSLLGRTKAPEEVIDRDYSENNSTGHPTSCVWKTVCSDPLEKTELVDIAKTIPRWPQLARYLKLSESDIAAIEENHMRDYEEQKMQMLLKWFEQQPTPPTRQNFVRIIEEQMNDLALAQDVVNIVHTPWNETT